MTSKCKCRDDMPCDYCLDQLAQDEAESREEARQAAREFWAEREADFMYDPLSKGGFE